VYFCKQIELSLQEQHPQRKDMHLGGIMFKHAIGGIFVASSLAGCTALNHAIIQADVSVVKVLDAIRCELAAAFEGGRPDPLTIANWGAVATLTLQLDDVTGVSPSLADLGGKVGEVEWKISTASTKFDNSINRKIVLEYDIPTVGEVDATGCHPSDSPLAPKGLDLAAWLMRVNAGMVGVPASVTMKTLSYDITFKVTASAGGSIVFKTPAFTAKLSGDSASRTDFSKLAILFKEPRPGQTRAALLDEIREERDAQEEEETTITVAPGQTIIIQ
jgi:hypothetical protein